MKIETQPAQPDRGSAPGSALQRAFAEPPSIEEEAEFKKLMIVEDLLERMAELGMKRGELAKRMGVRPSRVTSMLSGANNFTIETLVRAAGAVGACLEQTLVPADMKGHWVKYHEDEVHEQFRTIAKVRPVRRRTNAFHLENDDAEPAEDDHADAA